MRMKSKISFLLIYLLVVFGVLGILLLLFNDTYKNDVSNTSGSSQSTLIDNSVVNGAKEFLDVLGLNIYIKHEGEITIVCDEKYRQSYIEKGFQNSNIMNEKGLVIKISERIKDIKPFFNGGDGIQNEILILSIEGELYKVSLSDIKDNKVAAYKYEYDKKIASLTTGKLEYLDLTKRSLAKLYDESSHIIGPNNILEDITKYQIGKKVEILPLTNNYIIIENDGTARIGDFATDKYFSVSEEKWINKDIETVKQKHLVNILGLKYEIMDFEFVKTNITEVETNYDIYNIFFISKDGELLLLKYTNNEKIDMSKSMIPITIKTEKTVYKLELDKKGVSKYGIKNIVFTDGTFIDFEEAVKEYIEIK